MKFKFDLFMDAGGSIFIRERDMAAGKDRNAGNLARHHVQLIPWPLRNRRPKPDTG